MNFIGRRGAPEADARKGVSHLTMYADSPDEEITLEDLEVSAADRLKGESRAPIFPALPVLPRGRARSRPPTRSAAPN